eukprot:7228295-Ditylum_brightwellii.AAC.1
MLELKEIVLEQMEDYVARFGSEKMDSNVGKNLSAWDDVLEGNVFEGYPPVCLGITAEAEKV